MKSYVAGFLFSGEHVLLVRKNRPQWQMNLFNAVGGVIEDGEQSITAMCRKFREETQLNVPQSEWRLFCCERGPAYEVFFYASTVYRRPGAPVVLPVVPDKNDSNETLHWLRKQSVQYLPVVGNLHWLVQMACDWRGVVAHVTTTSDIRRRPSWKAYNP